MSDDRQIRALAQEIEELRRLVLQRGPQLGHSSFDNGSIGEYTTTPDGTPQLVARYGTQWDGTHTAVSYSGPTPPTPAVFDAVSIPVGLAVRWQGGWAGDGTVVAPSDWTRTEVHISTDPNAEGFGILFSTYRGAFESPRGGELPVVGLQSDTDYYVRLTARTESGKFSEPSAVFGPVRTGKVQPEDVNIDFEAIGGNTIYRGPTEPAGDHRIGDLWLKTPENIAYRWEGSPTPVWVETRDIGVAEALQDAFDAQATANRKTQTYRGPDAPVAPAGGFTIGDDWIEEDAGNLRRVWSGTAWVAAPIGNSAIQPNSLVASNVIATGTITAALFEAIMVLANTIIAGPPLGDHVRLGSAGLKIYSVDPDGQVVESSSLGGPGTDRLIITDPATGGTVASLGPSGLAVPLVTTDNLVVAGNTLDYILDQGPRGLVTKGGFNTGVGNTSTIAGTYDVEFTVEPERSYKIETSSLNLNPTTSSTYVFAALVIREADSGPTLVSSPVVVAQRGSTNLAGGIVPIDLRRTVSSEEIAEILGTTYVGTPLRVRVGLIYGVLSGGGQVSLFGNAQYPIHTYVYDVGVTRPFTGITNLGGGTSAPIITQRQSDFAATWGANWIGSSTAPRTGTSELIQGYSPYYPAGGSGIGQVGFGNFAAELAGSTIHWAALYVYTPHWHYDSGGTIMLGAHAYAAPPGSKPADWQLDAVRSSGHPKGGGGWIYLPESWFGGLASGATKGFTFGNGTTTDPTFYGRIVGDPSDTRRPVLRVNYSK